jgi:hypothetical protein
VNRFTRQLANSFEAYQYFPFKHRFERFKESKQYFLEGLSEEEVEEIYHFFIFIHYATYNRLFPRFTKDELYEYYDRRRSSE